MFLEIGLLLLLVFILVYYKVTRQFGFFKERGIPYDKPSFPFGSSGPWKVFTGRESALEMENIVLQQGFQNEKVVGYFMFGQPNFLINDEELSKRILIKDFDYFVDRRPFNTNSKYGDAFMTVLTGDDWKTVRSLMSGVFTSGKLKLMSKHIIKVGENFEKHISSLAESGTEVDMKVEGGLMTLDSIATAGFGIEVNSFKERENTFRVMAMTLIGAPGYASQTAMLKLVFSSLFPTLSKYLKVQFFPGNSLDFFVDIIRKTYKQRIETGQKRNDIIDIIVDELKSQKKGEKKEVHHESEFEKDAALHTEGIANALESGFDEETILISNALLFFFAGFETTSSGFSVCCHKLALYPDVQEKVYSEMEEVIGDGSVTFDKVQELKYMDMFIQECFRFQSLVPSLERVCVKDYKIPGTDYVVPKGRIVHTYSKSLSRDKNYFKQPNEFDPENFNPENNLNKFAYQAFGQGPRNCIGMRYALLTMKISLIHMLRKHRVVRGLKTTDVLVPDVKNFNVFKDGVFVKIEKR